MAQYRKARLWSVVWIASGLIFIAIGAIAGQHTVCSCPSQPVGAVSTCRCTSQAAAFGIESGLGLLMIGVAIRMAAGLTRTLR